MKFKYYIVLLGMVLLQNVSARGTGDRQTSVQKMGSALFNWGARMADYFMPKNKVAPQTFSPKKVEESLGSELRAEKTQVSDVTKSYQQQLAQQEAKLQTLAPSSSEHITVQQDLQLVKQNLASTSNHLRDDEEFDLSSEGEVKVVPVGHVLEEKTQVLQQVKKTPPPVVPKTNKLSPAGKILSRVAPPVAPRRKNTMNSDGSLVPVNKSVLSKKDEESEFDLSPDGQLTVYSKK